METEQRARGCSCFTAPNYGSLVIYQELGHDRHYGEVSLLICAACGQMWLHYLYENEAFSRSGRWYMGLVTFEQIAGIAAENALETFAGMEWYLYGGSYFDGKTGRSAGKIHL